MDQHLDFNGRVALVCGAETGAGAAIAAHLAARGARIMLGAADGALAERMARSVGSGGEATASGDTASGITVEACAGCGAAAVAATIGHFGRIDILVGVTPHLAPAAVTNGGAAYAAAGAAIAAAADALAAALPHMRSQDYGRIAWVTGASGVFPEPGCAGEAICSAAIAALLRTAAAENRAHDVRINVLAATIAGGNGDAVLRCMPHADPAHFPASAVMPLLAWLCHERCALDGEIMSAGGGRFARIFPATAPGYFNPALRDAGVAAALDQIISADGAISPRRASGELILTHV